MNRWLVCIAGGSGSGKSTLAINLYKKYPDLITVVGLDDYYKSYEEAPRRDDGQIDWETPEALCFDDLLGDLEMLLAGAVVPVRSKHELYNPGYRPELRNKIIVYLRPRRIILLEGYLALYDARIRNLAAFSVFLSMPIRQSLLRRSGNKAPQSEEYFKKILVPAHEALVSPTRKYADIELGTLERSPEEILSVVEGMLQVGKFLPK